MSCPSENELVAYVQGRSGPVRERVEGHLTGCASCVHVVSQLVRATGATTDGSPAPADGEPLRRGTQVSGYWILNLVGVGGMSVVYRAYDPRLDRRVALKFLRATPAPGSGPDSSHARLLREAQAMARLAHPNVVTVHEVGTWGDKVFIAMELVEGATLSSWLEEAPRQGPQIVRAFVAAGRGLAAAHAAGIVHRDFKPSNVLVAPDGRVKVTDFGLARPLEDSAPTLPPAASQTVTPTLTQSGALVGTPAYMSPEQLAGAPGTTHSDQFSFCVALYEALYGNRPFRGSSWEALQREMRSEVPQPPERAGVPRRVRRVVLRGLRPDPADRHPSMEALLHELERGAAPGRNRWLAAAGAAAFVVLAGAGWVRWEDRPRRLCAEGAREAEARWQGASLRIHDAFATTGLGYAETAFARVDQSLAAFAAAWGQGYRESCEATRVRGAQSSELMDLRMQCLGERLKELDALSHVLEQPDPALVAKAPDAARALTPVALCADTQALAAPLRLPADPAARAAIDAVKTTLAQARALKDAGKYAQALERAQAAALAADPLHYAPVSAESLLLRGQLEALGGDLARSEVTLREAIWAGDAGRNDRARALAWIQLLRNASGQGQAEAAQRLARHAEAAIARLGGDDDLEAGRLNALAVLAYNRGQYEDALGLFERMSRLRERDFGRDSIQAVPAWYGAGMVLGSLGRYDEALTYQRRALATVERELGPEHPDVARNASGIGATLNRKGDLAGAAAQFQRAVEIGAKSLGPDHPLVGAYLSNLGDTYLQQRKFKEALEVEQRALAVEEGHLPPDHPDLSYTLTGLGEALVGLGQPERALPPLERAARLPGEPEHLADVRFALATALADSKGDLKRARVLATQARAALQDKPDHYRVRLGEIDAWLARH
jgi:tetratricopeptide (TPR) repeat protein